MSFIKTFDQVIKHNFDQTPVLLENFDQVIRSSAIRSSDPMSFGYIPCCQSKQTLEWVEFDLISYLNLKYCYCDYADPKYVWKVYLYSCHKHAIPKDANKFNFFNENILINLLTLSGYKVAKKSMPVIWFFFQTELSQFFNWR